MKQSLSWKPSSANQETPHHLNMIPEGSLSWLTLSSHWTLLSARLMRSISSYSISLKFRFNIVLIYTPRFLSCFFLFIFPTKNVYAYPISVIRATYTVHRIRPDFALLNYGDAYKSWWFSVWSFLNPPATPPLFSPNIFLGSFDTSGSYGGVY